MGPELTGEEAPMPPPLNPFYKKLKPVEYTSTSWAPQPYKEYTTETEPPPKPLPNYYPKSYPAPHNPNIPYREVTTKKEDVKPYTHYFPKYTTTYYYPGYKKESIRIGYDSPYEEKKYEEPKYEEEKKYEQPKYEQPKYEEPKYEQPKYEEEKKYEEPKYEKPKYE